VVAVAVAGVTARWLVPQKYKDGAAAAGYAVKVMEVDCPNMDVLKVRVRVRACCPVPSAVSYTRCLWLASVTRQRFQERNSHGVDETVARRMYGRWEVDDDAIVVPPYGCSDLDMRRPQVVRLRRPLVVTVTATTTSPLSFFVVVAAAAVGARAVSSCASAQRMHCVLLQLSYVGVILEEASRKQLLAAFTPAHERHFGDHVTVAHRPNKETLERLLPKMGVRVSVRVIGDATDSRVQVRTTRCGR
jgi:hypothetical protein